MPEDKVLILEAAILAARGLGQEQIGQALGVNQTTVSRRLKRARELHYIVNPPPQLQLENIGRQDLDRAKSKVSAGHLRDQILPLLNGLAGEGGDLIFELSIVYTPIHGRDKKEWDERLRVLCRSAAQRLPELLAGAERVGVAWGNTLRFLVDELISMGPRPVRGQPVVFPVVGTFPHTDKEHPYSISLTSTRVAIDLANVVHGEVPESQVTLAAVPAYIPVEFEHIRDELGSFYSKLPGYREVFGGPGGRNLVRYPNALMNAADMLLTGMGDMPSSQEEEGGSPSLRERLKHEDARQEDWSQICIGDISGVLLPRYEIETSKKERVYEINRRFIGVGLEDLQAIASRCTSSKGETAGVVCVAHDKSKAPTVIEAVRNRCVSRLFLDEDLAKRVLEILSS